MNKIEFVVGRRYNAAQTIHPSALANNHSPLCYMGLVFVKSESFWEEYRTDLTFTYLNAENPNLEPFEEEIVFDEGFVNNGGSFDNSMIIVEAK